MSLSSFGVEGSHNTIAPLGIVGGYKINQNIVILLIRNRFHYLQSRRLSGLLNGLFLLNG